MSKLKVLIVDDEKPARELLKYLIDWEKIGFEICGQAINGKDGFEKYRELMPDLIITDIQMPIMSGLELIKKIRAENSKQKIVILSCYEDFSYAREAIKMNVKDYLVKDLLSEDDLIQLLLEVKEELILTEESYKVEDKIDGKIEEKLANEELKKYLLYDESLENSVNNKKVQKDFILFLLSIDDYYTRRIHKLSFDKDRIKKCLTNTLQRFNQNVKLEIIYEFTYLGSGRYAVICLIDNKVSESKMIKDSCEIANQIRKHFYKKCDGNSVTIAISKTFREYADLKYNYEKAVETLKFRLFLGKGKNLIYNLSIPKVTKISEVTVHNRMESIREAFDNNDDMRLTSEVKTLYEENLNRFMQYNYLKEINGQLIYLISKVCNDFNISYRDIFGMNYIPIQIVNEYDTVEEISNWFIKNFQEIIKIKKEKNKYSRHVSDAINFIYENYEETISLNEIAEVLNIHKVYLSRIFKEETGITISKFILKYRMNIAKKLMKTTTLKLYEIAEKVGYKNPQQFFVAFKREEGITPKSFRETYR